MKVLKVHKQFLGGHTDVSLEVPEFENFGKRMDELERLADEANPIDAAEMQASTAKLMGHVQELREQARKKLDATPPGAKKGMDAVILGLLEGMAQGVAESQSREEDSDGEEEDVDPEQPEPRDLHRVELSLPKGIKWNEKTQAVVEGFFADWPQLRSVVLKATFDHYRKDYAEFLTLFPGHKGLRFILPEPTSPEAIADLFYIETIHLHQDGSIGLSGNSTWEPEHGYGILLKSGKAKAVGEADVVFC